MLTRWFNHLPLLLALATATVTLMVAHEQTLKVSRTAFRQGLTNSSQYLKEAGEQVMLAEIQYLERLGSVDPLPTPLTIPFDYVGGHILVPVQVEDWVPAKMLIFDSGVRSSLLDRMWVADVPLAFPLRITPTPEVKYGVLRQISLSHANFHNVGAFVVDFSAPDQPLYCLSDSGVLGASLMRHAIWQIDYGQQQLTVASSVAGLDHVQDAIAIPFELLNRSPVITLGLGHQQRTRFLVDTGWGGILQLAASDLMALDSQDFLVLSTTEGLVETLKGVTIAHQKTVRIPDLSLGSLTLQQVPAVLSYGDQTQPYSLIGNGFLEHFIVTLDWPNQFLYLKPVAPVTTFVSPLPTYGFQSLMQNQSLWITGLQYPSPAAQAGLQIGDRILAINNDRYTHLPQEEFCTFVQTPVGDRYTGPLSMTIERRGQRFAYTLGPAAQPKVANSTANEDLCSSSSGSQSTC